MEAVQLARAGAPISIDLAIQEDLWSASVDPGQIGQVLQNILLNARQAMPDGGIVEIRAQNVAAEGPADRVRISIRDCGCGIPADVVARIFDPYFTTKPGGKGLGLATAYAIVAKHAGSLPSNPSLAAAPYSPSICRLHKSSRTSRLRLLPACRPARVACWLWMTKSRFGRCS